MPLTAQILIGLISGLAVGSLKGLPLEPIKAAGDIYIGLMQMTVLPFIVFSLSGSIGQLTQKQLGILGKTGLWTYTLLWLVVALTTLAFALSFPELETSRFFSSSLVETPPTVDWLKLFIPSNPFRALADNAVPAVVLFCILFGIGLIGKERGSAVTEPLKLCAKSLHRVNALMVRATPLGLFAIAAHTVGTTPLHEFERLEAYYLVLGACMLMTTFVVLPLLVASFTALRYREVIGLSMDSLVTAFVTGSVLSSLPVLIDSTKRYYQRTAGDGSQQAEFAEFILPLAYPFPNSGHIAALLFIPFSAWFVGQRLSLGEDIHLIGLGSVLMFGKVFLAIPFLLNTFRIPEDMFQLFLAAGVVAGRLSDTLGAMHYMAFTLIATARMTGTLTFRAGSFSRALFLGSAAVGLTILGIHPSLERLSVADDTRHLILNRSHALDTATQQTVLDGSRSNPEPLHPGESRLDRIRRCGVLRVGYQPAYLPYSFQNSAGDLVGLDVDLARRLAEDLGVRLVWVPWSRETLSAQLAADHFDLALSGLSMTAERASQVLLTLPYLEVNLGLIVPDHRRSDFSDPARIRSLPNLHMAVLEGSLFAREIQRLFPKAQITPLQRPEDYFEKPHDGDLVLAMHAESAAAWTLLYPQYSVVNPLSRPVRAPLAIAVGGFDLPLQNLVNTWITIQKVNGTLDLLTDYWFLGKARPPEPAP